MVYHEQMDDSLEKLVMESYDRFNLEKIIRVPYMYLAGYHRMMA